MEIENNIQFHRLCEITHSKELLSGKEFAWQHRRHKSPSFSPWVGKIPWFRKQQHTPVFLSGESHGQSVLVGYHGIARSQTEQLSNFWRLNIWAYEFFNITIIQVFGLITTAEEAEVEQFYEDL